MRGGRAFKNRSKLDYKRQDLEANLNLNFLVDFRRLVCGWCPRVQGRKIFCCVEKSLSALSPLLDILTSTGLLTLGLQPSKTAELWALEMSVA